MPNIWYFPLDKIKEILHHEVSEEYTYYSMFSDILDSIKVKNKRYSENIPKINFEIKDETGLIDLLNKRNGDVYEDPSIDENSLNGVFRKFLLLIYKFHL